MAPEAGEFFSGFRFFAGSINNSEIYGKPIDKTGKCVKIMSVPCRTLRNCVRVARQSLNLFVAVRIRVPQPKNSYRQPAVAVFLTVQDGKQKREYLTHQVKYKEPPCCGALPFLCPGGSGGYESVFRSQQKTHFCLPRQRCVF